MDHDDPNVPEQAWQQVFVHFDDYTTAERIGAVHVGPAMTDLERSGVITSWFFIRKNPCWRLRFLPSHAGTGSDTTAGVHRRLEALAEGGHIKGWTDTIYEPEVHAFGGPEGMIAAHDLFHLDSVHVLGHLAELTAASPENRRDRRRELSILLCRNLLHGAHQDWYEQGDVWARVADMRPAPPATADDRANNLHAQLRRLMTVDADPAGPLLGPTGSLANLGNWAAGFTACGQVLGDLAHTGALRRGTRAVLAHHVIFHWNRLGLSHTTQSLLAHTAKAVVFDPQESAE
ncbi:thiopeptide-type bacteriocin biosynthesis protein [Umezawaea sp. Da 62-37]|uniref:thiopeptide-type bacteriocin biosynthesis protein n=1 Tax=Umezawaea sp. Da 62-37 TaxID=3075927 RepID=UPI0028F70758|nr:thiopeptide-type bacteriocin biosynthesis protein [Umezawaea sp. Da 62-37]WNV90243.1 thiopeptide-type bacteriocin biosynthesis protein [Umezawaea sp. Da 62-37]